MTWVALAVLGVSALAVGAWRLDRHSRVGADAFAQICEAVGAYPSGRKATGIFNGTAFALTWTADAERRGGGTSSFCIVILGRSRRRFEIVRSDQRTVTSKRIGSASAVDTGDAEFDQAFNVTASTREDWGRYFIDGKQQYAIRKLFDLGATGIVLDGHRLEATWTSLDMNGAVETQLVTAAIGYLQLLADALPGFLHARVPSRRRPDARLRSRRAWLFSTALLAAGVGAAIVALQRFPPLDLKEPLIASVPGIALSFAVGAAGIVWILHGTASSRFAAWVISSTGAVGASLLAFGLVLLINGTGGATAVDLHTARVIAKVGLDHPSWAPHLVRLHSPQSGHEDEWVPVTADVFRQATPQQSRVIVTARPGRLGFEWVDRVTTAH